MWSLFSSCAHNGNRTVLSCFPKLLLQSVKIHGAYVEQAIGAKQKKLWPGEQNKTWYRIYLSTFWEGLPGPYVWVHSTPAVNQLGEKKSVTVWDAKRINELPTYAEEGKVTVFCEERNNVSHVEKSSTWEILPFLPQTGGPTESNLQTLYKRCWPESHHTNGNLRWQICEREEIMTWWAERNMIFTSKLFGRIGQVGKSPASGFINHLPFPTCGGERMSDNLNERGWKGGLINKLEKNTQTIVDVVKTPVRAWVFKFSASCASFFGGDVFLFFSGVV